MKKIQAGDVLFASHLLEGTDFQDTIILIVDNNEDGVFGLIINRASHMPLSEIFNISLPVSVTTRLVYMGGPVDEDMLLTIVIHPEEQAVRDGKTLSPTVEYGGKWENLQEIVESDDKSVRTFLGYTGWKERQLHGEINEGSWTVYRDIDTEQLLTDWYEPLTIKRREMLAYLDELGVEDE